LNADEFEVFRRRAFYLEAQLNGFSNSECDFVQGAALGMAPRDLWNRSDVEPFLVAFNDNIKLALQ
jgi:hypothetical protein